MSETRKEHLLPWNFWCRLFGHKLVCQNKWLIACPNIGLWTCSRCGGEVQTMGFLLNVCRKNRIYPIGHYCTKGYIEDAGSTQIGNSDIQVNYSDIEVLRSDLEEPNPCD